MPPYIGLLRGVNVGRNTLKMQRLRDLCAELGLRDARTYVQSGNLVFAAQGTSSPWSKALEQKLSGESRLAVSVMVRTAAEIAKIIAANPFLAEKGIDPAKLHVTFLDRAPARTALAALAAVKAGADRFHHAGLEIYLHCPDGYGRTKLSNTTIERLLAVRATTRNWNTVNKLHAMALE